MQRVVIDTHLRDAKSAVERTTLTAAGQWRVASSSIDRLSSPSRVARRSSLAFTSWVAAAAAGQRLDALRCLGTRVRIGSGLQ
jgi:hypothetical protein